MVRQFDLFNPDWEPSDDELLKLAERAWAAAAPAHDFARQLFEHQLSDAAAAAIVRTKSRAPDGQ